MKTHGQWIGTFNGPTPGFATLNIEKDRPGRAFVCAVQGKDLPASRIEFAMSEKEGRFQALSEQVLVFDGDDLRLKLAIDFRPKLPSGFVISDQIAVDGVISGGKIIGKWSGDSGLQGNFELYNPCMSSPTKPDEVKTWQEYKVFIAENLQANRHLLFRGHADNTWRLRSSLHRTGRYDLLRYGSEVTGRLREAINAVSSHKYDAKNSEHFAALMSVAQHHGFPTPLLDWTKSPYIAAFFAFEKLAAWDSDFCRVYAFDGPQWSATTNQLAHFDNPAPVVAVRDFPAFENLRKLPQQSVHSFVNVEDVEELIRLRERLLGKHFLTVIDIPRSERMTALKDMTYMGITAASLFPGLDGVCRALRDEYFLD